MSDERRVMSDELMRDENEVTSRISNTTLLRRFSFCTVDGAKFLRVWGLCMVVVVVVGSKLSVQFLYRTE